jgi:hypothetical protein
LSFKGQANFAHSKLRRIPAMSEPSGRPIEYPEGLDFLMQVSEEENACESETRLRIPELGKMVPACYQELGTVLSLLNRAASCSWGCRGGDHLIEYLAGRVCAYSRSAIRLLLFGFYDESLSLTRSIGEIGNLLLLFNQEPSALPQWRVSDKDLRMTDFGPKKVRKRLKNIGRDKSVDLKPLIVDDDRYVALSEIATHPTPQIKPQAHNAQGKPSVGARFQEAGLVVSLNELARAVACAVLPIPKLLGYDDQRRGAIRERAIILLSTVGGLSVENQQEMFAEIRRQLETDV